jgi:serine/threonine protein kinase
MSLIACPGCRTLNTEFNAFCRVCSIALTAADASAGPSSSRREPACLIPTGTLASHYEVQELIGAGAMGQVYRAYDRNLSRPVALKFLSQGLAGDKRAKERLRREAQAASALDHPGIATIFEVAEHEGRPFIAMMLYEGETLAAALARGPLPVSEVTRIGVELASALTAAHGAGIVHRDVKPANVILTRSGGVKLVDFGLAKLVSSGDATALTRMGAILGTVAYMAPEQLAGEVIDHRADLWSLGVVLYEAVSGRLPIVGAGLAHRILTKDPDPLSEAPRALARLVMRLLKKDPAMRIKTAAEVERLLKGLDRSHGFPLVSSISKPAAITGGLTLAAAIGAAIAVSRGSPRQEPTPDTPRTEQRATRSPATVQVAALAAPSAFVPAPAPTTGTNEDRKVTASAAKPTKRVPTPAATTIGSIPVRSEPLPSAKAPLDGLGLPEKPF